LSRRVVKNILIAGVSGFIGKNFVKYLNNRYDLNILGFSRGANLRELLNGLEKIDYFFHFAGEVDKSISKELMVTGNENLTSSIISVFFDLGLHPSHIVYSSTIHANHPEDEYGKTKFKSEVLLKEYNQKIQNNKLIIYRLPHLFGAKMKPYHNSVLATWAYSIKNNLPITIFDSTQEIGYLHVSHFFDSIFRELKTNDSQFKLINLSPKYKITTGHLAELLSKFKEQDGSHDSTPFLKELFEAYKTIEETNVRRNI